VRSSPWSHWRIALLLDLPSVLSDKADLLICQSALRAEHSDATYQRTLGARTY
jgi:hypothetical protein